MSSSRLPPDPYKILGVEKDAQLPQIRSAHRKLVLQCHPDKIQDPELKAKKVDEFQKVQEAYETLSDDAKRSEYDNTVKLHKLREELGKGSTSRHVYDFDANIRTAEPRSEPRPEPKMSSSFPKTKQPKESPIYSKPPPRSFEDLYEESPRPAYRRSRTTTRESDRDERDRRRQQEDEERMRKEAKRSAHKKTRDREKKRGVDDKVHSRTTGGPYVEDDSEEDEYRRLRADKKAAQRKMEEEAQRVQRKLMEDAMRAEAEHARRAQELRERERELQRDREQRERDALKRSPVAMDDKWASSLENATRYVQASRQVEPKPEVPFAPIPPPMMRRADTYAAPATPYNIRYETVRPTPVYTPESDDDEAPRRSSARSSRRPTMETPTRSKDTTKSSRRVPRDPYIVEPPTPPTTKPSLQKQYSEPPFVGPGTARREPSRSKTDYHARKEAMPIPTMNRAATFTHGYTKDSRASRAAYTHEPEDVSDSESDSESPSPAYAQPSRPRREADMSSTKTYVVNQGKSELKGASYRSDLRDDGYVKVARARSPSPTRRSRPPLTRSGASGSRQTRSQSRGGYHPASAPEVPEPIVVTAQPKTSRDAPRSTSRSTPYAGQYSVNYAPPIRPEQIVYAPPGVQYTTDTRRPAESGHRDYDYHPHRSRTEGVYA